LMRQWQHRPVSSLDATPSDENRPQHRSSTISIQENVDLVSRALRCDTIPTPGADAARRPGGGGGGGRHSPGTRLGHVCKTQSVHTKLLFILQMWSKDCGNIQKPAKHATNSLLNREGGIDRCANGSTGQSHLC
jgi:hypothetical protein